MIIFFKNILGTFLVAKSENIAAFVAEDENYSDYGAVNICMIMTTGKKEIINAFFYKNPSDNYCDTRIEAGKYLDRISNLLIENAGYAEVYSNNRIILSDGREL